MADFCHINAFQKEKFVMRKSLFEGMNLNEVFTTHEERQEEILGMLEEMERNANYLLEVISDIRKLVTVKTENIKLG